MEQGFHKLIAWQEEHELALAVYGVIKDFPSDERFGLVSQMRLAASARLKISRRGDHRDARLSTLDS